MYLKEVEGETAGSRALLSSGSRPDCPRVPATLVSRWCYCWGPESCFQPSVLRPPYSAISLVAGILASAPGCSMPAVRILTQPPPLTAFCMGVALGGIQGFARSLQPPRLCLEKCGKASRCLHVLVAPHFLTLPTLMTSENYVCLSPCLPPGLTHPSVTPWRNPLFRGLQPWLFFIEGHFQNFRFYFLF